MYIYIHIWLVVSTPSETQKLRIPSGKLLHNYGTSPCC